MIHARLHTTAGLAAVALAVSAGVASAGIPDPVVTVSVTSGGLTGSFDVTLADNQGTADFFFWNFASGGGTGPIQIFDDNGGGLIAEISSGVAQAALESPFDPADQTKLLSFAFTVKNFLNADTSFAFDTGDLTFNNISGDGSASTAFTLTDNDNNGASIAGTGAGGAFGTASYNGGTLFGNLLQGGATSVVAGGSDAGNEDLLGVPLTGVNSLQLSAGFTLSANDSGSINTQWFGVPSPAALALLTTGGLIAARRRRA